MSNKRDIRALAFVFPQFHPIKENDELWGKGFTEWFNCVKAKPLFFAHYQPHIPTDLGFYDLRLPETREAQTALAREYGIYGFCYYHYWLHGRRLLERPVNEILKSGKPDFPFCLCWANENWTKKWDGQENYVLVRQNYSEKDDIEHINYLCREVFSDKRYIRIDGKPLFIIYRAKKLPNLKKTISIWRAEAKKYGLELYLCRMETFCEEHDEPYQYGFDAAVEFQPDWLNLGDPLRKNSFWEILRALGLSSKAYAHHKIYEYRTIIGRMMKKELPQYKRYPCVTPMWDNTPRVKADGTVLRNSSPELYEEWLTHVVKKFKPFGPEENFVFICAWNEWAEGNHIEPCIKWGRGYLEATKRALNSA